jgi:hypothetical protein
MKIPQCGELLDAGNPISNSVQHSYRLASPVGVMLAKVAAPQITGGTAHTERIATL